MKNIGVDFVDEHFYRPEDWFMNQASRYDIYDRKGPKVYAGEYACHERGKKWNHFNSALMEAAFMTGLERNADVVPMSTYAPLFAHVEGWQWRPDMIWFDNLNSVATSSYYVQSLFSNHKGEKTVPITLNGEVISGKENQRGLFATASVVENPETLIIKIVNTDNKAQVSEFEINGLNPDNNFSSLKVITLTSLDPNSENSLENPTLIQPQEETSEIDLSCNSSFRIYLPPLSLSIIRLE